MNNSDTRLFLYDNVIDITLTTNGDLYVDNRPMNNRRLMLHKGVTNDLYFNVRDRDRKLQNLYSDVVRAYIVQPTSKKRVLTKMLTQTGEIGKMKLTVLSGDLANLNPGLYNIFLTKTNSETSELPIYTNQDNGMLFDVEITDQVNVNPVDTQSTENFLQISNTNTGDSANVFSSDALYGNLDRNFMDALHSIAIYPDTYTGQVTIQASCLVSQPSNAEDSLDWFDVMDVDLSNTSNISHQTFNINANWIRVLSTVESGSISKVLLRN